MKDPSWPVKAVAVLGLVVLALSLFFVHVGVPYSSLGCQGSSTGGASTCSGPTTVFVPLPQALVGVAAGAAVLAGVVGRRLALAWAGTAAILAFGALGILSIGVFFLLPGMALLVLLALDEGRRRGESTAAET